MNFPRLASAFLMSSIAINTSVATAEPDIAVDHEFFDYKKGTIAHDILTIHCKDGRPVWLWNVFTEKSSIEKIIRETITPPLPTVGGKPVGEMSYYGFIDNGGNFYNLNKYSAESFHRAYEKGDVKISPEHKAVKDDTIRTRAHEFCSDLIM